MRFSKRTKKKLHTLTPLDAERESKLRAEEEAHKIDVMGQENEKIAAKWVIEEGKEKEKEEKREEDEALTRLTDAKKKILSYKELLVRELQRGLYLWNSELPKGWIWQGGSTSKGIVLFIRGPMGFTYARGMKVSTLPYYDLNGLRKLMGEGLDFIETETKKKRESGIILHE